MRDAIGQLKEPNVEPNIWKLEGLELPPKPGSIREDTG
jgi:hypothetical protein